MNYLTDSGAENLLLPDSPEVGASTRNDGMQAKSDDLLRESLPGTKSPAAGISIGMRIAGIFLRALFIGTLLVVVARVSFPQSESIWSVYETPGDLVRLALGFAAGVWI